jgi:hypothetical protein
VLTRPRDLDDGEVAAAMKARWSLAPSRLEYAPLGFGSHHWIDDTHFVSVDELADANELKTALRTAQALRDDAGLDFVIAPLPADDGSLIVPVGEGWVMHVYERLTITDDVMFGPHTDPEVVDLVRAIHDATTLVRHHPNIEDFSIWERDDLEEALGDLDSPWDTGPYGERTRQLLAQHADDVVAMLAAHDRLIEGISRDNWVVTHGEPHRGNVFRTMRGWAIVDWDTALVAPPERDFWDLPGTPGDPFLTKLYRLRWDLCEVAVYVAGFYDDHTGDANDDLSWKGLVNYIDLRRRWPDLL